MAPFLSLRDIPEDKSLRVFTRLPQCIPVELLQPFTSLVHCVDEAVEGINERKDFQYAHHSQLYTLFCVSVNALTFLNQCLTETILSLCNILIFGFTLFK